MNFGPPLSSGGAEDEEHVLLVGEELARPQVPMPDLVDGNPGAECPAGGGRQ